MAAFSQRSTTACLLLWSALLYSCATAAPAPVSEGDLAQSQALEYHNDTGASRCYYNFQHYEEGDRIVTNEPCLNCTCHKRMLMCYLRVCPFTKAVGQDCTVEKKPDQCCPVITCPEVPVDILTSSTTTLATPSSAVGHLSNYGCTLEDNTFYPDGVQMPSDPKKPCELCYCIRNHTACVRQECTLNVEGCRPVYQEGVCCPVRYDCDYSEISTTEQPSTGGLVLGTTPNPLQCRFGDTVYNDGELMVTDKPCESCYCMRGDIVCAVRSCGEPMEGKDCQALPPPEGECCPTTYQCANETIPIEALVTESSIIMHMDDLQTQGPLKNSENDPIAPESTNTELEESNEDKKEETPVVDQHTAVPVEEGVSAIDVIEEKPVVDQSEEGSVSNSEVTPSEHPEDDAKDQENNIEGALEVNPSVDQSEEGSVLQAEVSPSEIPEESVKEPEMAGQEHQVVDQSEDGSVIQAEVSPSEMPEEGMKEPEKNIEDKIEDENLVAGESILSDPINADEVEEEDILSGHIPTIDEYHSSSDIATDTPTDSLENLATSAPGLIQEEESTHYISSSNPEEPLTEGPLNNSGPSGIESDSEESGVAPTQSDINVLNESDEKENTLPEQPEIPSAEDIPVIYNNESTSKPSEEEVSHELEASQEHSTIDHVQDEHESQSLPSDSDIVTETAQIHSDEAQEMSTKSTEQSITENTELLSEGNEQKVAEEAASEANVEDTKVDQPQTHNDVIESNSNLTEQPLDVKPEGETESQGLVEDVSHEPTNAEDTNKEIPESEPVSSDSTEPAQEENKEPGPENEDAKSNESVEETKEPDASMENESPVVLEESISSVPESPESLDQVKESEISNEKDEIGSIEQHVVSHPEENDTGSASENVQSSHDEVESESNNSGLPDQTIDENESTDVPTNANTNVQGEIVHKEPIPPRKDDTVPEEYDQPPQHHEGSMTKAEDSIPTDPPLELIPVETEVPIKTEDTENSSEQEQSTEPNIKPLDEITEHDVKHDDSEQSTSDVQQEDELHESTDVQTESNIASEVPPEPSLLPEVASENTSEVTSEDIDNNNTESPHTVITDQQPPSNPDSTSDQIENESTSNDSILEESLDNEGKITENKENDTSNENESVPSVVVTETDVPTNSVSDGSEVKPEGPDSSVTSEGASVIFDKGDESQASQTDKPDQESEETTSQGIHDDHPESSDSDSSSADSTQDISDSEETNEQTKEEHIEGNEVSGVSDKVTNDGTPANTEEETSTDQHNVAEVSETEVNEIPEKTGEDRPQDTEKSTESSEPKFPLSETTEQSEPAKDAVEDHADSTVNELQVIESTPAPSVNQGPDNNHSETAQSEDVLVNSEDSVKESQTEIPIIEDTSANAIHQDDHENKPEEQNHEEQNSENKPEESSETQSPTVNSEPEKAAEETPDTNEFHEVAHDPVESDPTDFEDQHFEDSYHPDQESPSENEIVDDHLPGHGGSIQPEVPVPLPGPVGIVPGEGDCLVDGQTYTNNSKIPSKSPCHKECICLSSILHCQGIDCPPPPPQLANCMPVHQNDLCCPVYTCDGDILEGPQAHNHMGVSEEEEPHAENHSPNSGDEKATEIPAHSQDDVSTDLPNNQGQETSQVVTPEETSEPQPENNVQPEGEATEVVSEAQDTVGAALETNTPSEEVPNTEAVNPPVPDETNIDAGEVPNSSSPAHEEEGNVLPSDIVSHEDETKLTDDSSNSSPTESSEKDLLENNAEQQPLAESVPVETQTNTAETSEVEDPLSITSVPDSTVHLEDVHKEEDIENQAEILTDQSEIHDESGTESSISTDNPLLHKEEQPPMPDDTNVVSETENPQSAVGEDGSPHQPEDGSGKDPTAEDSVETENNENDVPATEVSNENGNPIEIGTEVPTSNSADNELSPNSENESLVGEENINSKPEDNSSVNNAEASSIEISTPNVSQDESDIPVKSNEESASVDIDLDVKPTLTSDESVQPEGSITWDDSSSSPLDTEDHPVTEGQEIQITNEEEHETTGVEELENSNAEPQNHNKITEQESLNEPTEQISSETGEISEPLSNTPLPDSNEPTEKDQETVESHFPGTNVDETSSESTSNVQTEHHADAIETIHSEEPLHESLPDSEDGVTQELSTEDTEKTTSASVDKIENNNSNNEKQNEITEPAQQVPVEGQEPGEVDTGSESGDLDEISEIQTEASHFGDSIESKPLDEQHEISEVGNVESGAAQTPETDDTISHHSAIDSNSEFSTENPFGSDHGPSTKEPTTEVELSTKIYSDDVNDPNASDDISISTEGYGEAVKDPESDDLTLSAGPDDVVSVEPQNNEGSPETVPSSHESEVSVENEVSSSSSEVGETDHQSPVHVAPDQASQEGESSVSEDNQTVDKVVEPANDSEQESGESEVPNQGQEQQIVELEHPSQEVSGSSEGQESTELPSISEHEITSQVDDKVSEHGESEQENVHIKEHSPQEDVTPSDIDTSVTDDQAEVHGEEESDHKEDIPTHVETPTQDEKAINGIESTSSAEGALVHGEESIIHEGEGSSLSAEDTAQGNTVDVEQGSDHPESEQPTQESNEPIKEEESSAQEQDHSVPESADKESIQHAQLGHPVEQESDQHIQEPEHHVDQESDQHIQESEHTLDQESDQHIQEQEHHVDHESDQNIQEPEHTVDQESDQHIQEEEHPVDQESDQHIQEPEHPVHQESDQHVQEPEHPVDQESDLHIQDLEHHVDQESDQHIQEPEHPVHQESDQHVQEPEHPVDQESDLHIQEPQQSIPDSNLSIQDPGHLVHDSDQIIHETEESIHPLNQPEDSNSVLPPSGESQINKQDESKPESSKPADSEIPNEDQFPTGADIDYDVTEDGAFGPGTCRYGGKVYVSAQQIPRDDPCDFCFCFRSDIICLQQSCPPPIHRCHQEPIQGYCCPRYQCPVSMATSLNLTTTTTTTTTTLPPHFFAHAYQGAARQSGCLHRGQAYNVGEEITTASGPCLQCICGADGQMKCDPVVCSPEPMLRKMMEAAISHRRR